MVGGKRAQWGGHTGQRHASPPRQDEWDGRRLHGDTQNGMKFNTDKMFISEVLHLIFRTMVDCRSPKLHKAKPDWGRGSAY